MIDLVEVLARQHLLVAFLAIREQVLAPDGMCVEHQPVLGKHVESEDCWCGPRVRFPRAWCGPAVQA